MCLSCSEPLGFGKFYTPPPPRCWRCAKLCDKQIGKWAAVHYTNDGPTCCRCWLLVNKQTIALVEQKESE